MEHSVLHDVDLAIDDIRDGQARRITAEYAGAGRGQPGPTVADRREGALAR